MSEKQLYGDRDFDQLDHVRSKNFCAQVVNKCSDCKIHKNWLGSEVSKVVKISPQCWSPGSKMENSSFRPRDLNFFKISNRFS